MPDTVRWPHSARRAWLQAKEARRARSTPRLTPEEREAQILARELARMVRACPDRDLLHQVARVLGKGEVWFRLVRIEAHQPGTVGKASLRSAS